MLEILRRLNGQFTRELAAEVLGQIVAADKNWPAKRKTILREPLKDLFDDAQFLASVAPVKNGSDPLAEDWNWVRGQMMALLRLAQNFAARFAARKRDDGVLDFHDLEQFALKLLWNFAADKPTPTAERWRKKLRFVFVDEYQDINAAQDKIIQALSRGDLECSDTSPFQSANVSAHSKGNRFLVGDVKQSIYRFRLADPKIFRDYAKRWRGENGTTIPLSENFRSRGSLLNLVNSVFSLVMREEIGGVNYDDEAKLTFGSPETRAELSAAKDPSPRTELLLRLKKKPGEVSDDQNSDWSDLEESAREARLIALRLNELKSFGHEIWDDDKEIFRAAGWRDMAVLLRAPSGQGGNLCEGIRARGRAAGRGAQRILRNQRDSGFVESAAIARQPVAGRAVHRGATLATRRLLAGRTGGNPAHGKGCSFLDGAQSLEQSGKREAESGNPSAKIEKFLNRFSRWRKLARQVSLSQCLEEVLTETHYADWLQSRPRGAQRQANVEQFLNLAQRFDQFQRQGLFRFLKFIEAQRDAGAEPEVAPVADENAVRLMSIHQSKGLEFPVVVVADLAKTFNEQDLRAEIILDGEFGLCPRVQPPQTGARYPSLPHWLAQRRQRHELRGEELRLLYVAMTRARDTLILAASVTEKNWDEKWTQPQPVTTQQIAGAKSFADWLAIWFGNQSMIGSAGILPAGAAATCRQDAGAPGGNKGELPELRWRIIPDAELGNVAGSSRADEAQTETNSEPPHVGCYEDDGEAEKLRARLEWNYPFKAATRRKAKSSVTELRRAAEELRGSGTNFQLSVFSKTARKDARPTGAKAESGKRKAEIVGGGNGNGASEVSTARCAGKHEQHRGA